MIKYVIFIISSDQIKKSLKSVINKKKNSKDTCFVESLAILKDLHVKNIVIEISITKSNKNKKNNKKNMRKPKTSQT